MMYLDPSVCEWSQLLPSIFVESVVSAVKNEDSRALLSILAETAIHMRKGWKPGDVLEENPLTSAQGIILANHIVLNPLFDQSKENTCGRSRGERCFYEDMRRIGINREEIDVDLRQLQELLVAVAPAVRQQMEAVFHDFAESAFEPFLEALDAYLVGLDYHFDPKLFREKGRRTVHPRR